MNPIGVALMAVLGYACLGLIVLGRGFYRPANQSIDHPVGWVRNLHRFSAFGIAYFVSFLATPFFVSLFISAIPNLKDESDLVNVLILVSYPVPLAIPSYCLLCKIIRGKHRR